MQPSVWLMPAIIDFLGYDPQPLPTNFRELILRNRRALGLNQPHMASLLGVSSSTLHDWERGLYEPGRVRKASVENQISRLTGTTAMAR